MRTDVTLIGISGNSLRWLRRLAPWSIVPLILGALVIATVALGSVSRYSGATAYQNHWGGHNAGMIGTARIEPMKLVESPVVPQKINLPLGQDIAILPEQGWSDVTLQGTALQRSGMMYVPVHRGTAVLSAHHGSDQWKYTVTVIPATH